MTSAFHTALAASVLTAATAVAWPAAAMPIATPDASSAIVKISSWATRASGHRHTYPGAYGYADGAGYGRPYGGGWSREAAAVPYGGYGRGLPPGYGGDYGYGRGYGAY